MKKECYFLLLLLFFSSCNFMGDDDVDYGLDEYEERLAEVLLIDGKTAFLLDNGSLLYDASSKTLQNVRDSARVKINYTVLDQITPGFDQTVRLNRMQQVGSGSLQVLEADSIASMPDDPVYFESAWTGGHYLNMTFSIEYKSKPHKIFLVTDPAGISPENEFVYLEFRQSNNGDDAGYQSGVVTSFSLKNVLGLPSGNKKLRLSVNSSNYGRKIYELNY